MTRYIEVNPEKCTACRICEYTCSTFHFSEINPAKSRIKVDIIAKDFFYFPVVCQQCAKAPCVEACPKEALIRNEDTGAVEVVTDNCIGCRKCVKACPFGAMNVIKGEKVANKCDLCGGDPQCVKHCFYGTLEFKESEKVSEDIRLAYISKVKAAQEKEEAI